MAKNKTAYVWNECGQDFPRWQGQCNACQEWRLETLKLVDGNMVSMGIRDYDFNNYQRLE